MASSTRVSAIQLEWYKVRDTLFGHNYVQQDIVQAFSLALSCSHPDARWLTQLCAGKDVKTMEQAINLFQAEKDCDLRALCFAILLKGSPYDMMALKHCADSGVAFAQGGSLLEQFFFFFFFQLRNRRNWLVFRGS